MYAQNGSDSQTKGVTPSATPDRHRPQNSPERVAEFTAGTTLHRRPSTPHDGAPPGARAADIPAGIVDTTGASVMVELGRPGALHPLTADSLRAALFTSGTYELTPAGAFGDVNRPWEDPRTFESEPEMEPADGWIWHNGDRVVEGIGWGGNLEIISWLLMADRAVLPAVLRALRQYAPDAMAVFDVDLGHTDPQLVVPVGGRIRVDGRTRRITVTY